LTANQQDKLLIVWTSGEIDVAKTTVFTYSTKSKLNVWWDEVTLLTCGASSKLLASNTLLQEELKPVREAGVKVIACKACAEKLGVVPELEALGIDVFYTGEFMTDWIKSGDKYITF